MKKYAKLLVLPVAVLGLASVSATASAIAISENAVEFVSESTPASTLKTTIETFKTGTFEASTSTTDYATCTTALKTAATYCTQADIDGASSGDPCKDGTENVTIKEKAVYTCTLTDLVVNDTATYSSVEFKSNGQALANVTVGDGIDLTITGVKVEVSKKVKMGKNTTLTNAGTLRGDIETAGAWVNNGSWSNGTVTYKTPGTPAKPSASYDAAEGYAEVTITKVKGATKYVVYRSTTVDGTYSKVGETTELTYKDKTVADGKSYFYKVAAVNAGGTSEKSEASAELPMTVTAPKSLKATVVDYKSVKLTAGTVKGATGYAFFRCEAANDCAEWTLLKTQTSNVYTDSKDIKTGVEYYYTVAAYVSNGSDKKYSKTFAKEGEVGAVAVADGKVAGEVANAVKATTKLGKAAISKIADSTTLGKLKVTITKVAGADGYVVFANNGVACITTSTTCTTEAQKVGDNNTYTVMAYRGDKPAAPTKDMAEDFASGEKKTIFGALSAEKEYTIKPEAPKLLSTKVKLIEKAGETVKGVEYAYYNTLKVTVSDYSSKIDYTKNEVTYVLYKSTSKNGTYTKVAESDAITAENKETVNTFYVTDLVTGKTYYFKAKVRVNGKLSAYSDVQSKATKMTPYGKNEDKDLLKASAKGEDEKYLNRAIELTLSPVVGAKGYSIFRSTSKNGKYTLVKNLSEDTAKANSYVWKNTKLNAGQKYYYKVQAYRTLNGKKVYGTVSSTVSATAKLKAVENVEVGDVTKKTVELAWDKVSGAAGYRVYNQDDEIVATVNKASATIKGLEAGTKYNFYVKAYANVNGKKKLGAASEKVEATTESSN